MSVVIPAHDEASVIERLLRRLLSDPRADELEIVVAPNGCSDDTAARAAAVAEEILVSEIRQASKIAALRECDRVATVFPRAYVDADVIVDTTTLLALADALEAPGGPLVASPTVLVDTDAATWPVRQHYRIWALTDYRRQGHIGSGIYALSRVGRDRFGDWPDVIADDRFIQQLFLPSERLTLPEHTFTVHSPRTLRAQVRRAARIVRGNRELPKTLQHARTPSPTRHLALAGRIARRPSLWPAAAIYATANSAAILRVRWETLLQRPAVWHRDDTTRTAHGG